MDFRPLSGIRVVELSHVIMGPMCGMVLAQLGAEVIKVEPLGGDPTRSLSGMGSSFFPLFNAGKKSVSIDLHSEAGKGALHRLLASADVLVENFRDSTISKLGLDAASLRSRFPDLIVASHKGFLSGPYASRPALDEVVQMMTGLAAMTGTRERPLRVGASLNDMMAGLFGVVGVLALLLEKNKGGAVRDLRVGLFENCLLAVAQHMVQFQLSGVEPPPLSQRVHAWPVYDRFTTADDRQIFVAATTEGHWQSLCSILGLDDLLADNLLSTANDRIAARERTLPRFAAAIAGFELSGLCAILEANGLPFSPVNGPVDMFDDPHVRRDGGLISLSRANQPSLEAPSLPMEFNGTGLVDELLIPELGQDTASILVALGLDESEIRAATKNTALR